MPIVGGLGTLKPVDQLILDILAKVDDQIKGKIGEGRNGQVPAKIEPSGYKTQVVSGTNFFVRVKVDDTDYFHIRIYRPIQGDVSLQSVIEAKPEEEEILYF